MPNENADDHSGEELKQKAKEVAVASEEMLEKVLAGLKIQDTGSANIGENEDAEQSDGTKNDASVSAGSSKFSSRQNKHLWRHLLGAEKNEVRFGRGLQSGLFSLNFTVKGHLLTCVEVLVGALLEAVASRQFVAEVGNGPLQSSLKGNLGLPM